MGLPAVVRPQLQSGLPVRTPLALFAKPLELTAYISTKEVSRSSQEKVFVLPAMRNVPVS